MTIASGLIFMVLEDHAFQRRTLGRMLRSMGAEVVAASDGRQALDLINSAENVPDVVVCDLNMPGMDGIEFIRHLGERKLAISVIICSAQDQALLSSVDKMTRAYGVRVLGVIPKPITNSALSELIARHKTQKLKTIQLINPVTTYTLAEILHGIEQKQFEPFYQPKVQFSTGQLVGAEALARWHHPENGLVGPYAFIPLLEESGKLDELTLLILNKAAIACRTWRSAGFDSTVSVNLSLRSLNDTHLADRITQTVDSAGLEPRHMVLEITETTAMTEVAPALENLARLRMRGFGLSIDDFGTGFSSLRQLTRVPFSELKIDQSFVTGCATNSASQAIIESSVEMARRLGIKSVAEGVETLSDWDNLRKTGCELAQGYFIAKPMDEKSFLVFCTSFKPVPLPTQTNGSSIYIMRQKG